MRNWMDLFESTTPPSILWHGSDQKVEGPYRPLTHFGTELAANQRALSVVSDWKRQPEPTGYNADGPIYPERVIWLHPVHVNIQNPLTIRDFNNLMHTPIKLADMLHYDLRAISALERSMIFQAGQYHLNTSNPAGITKMIEILAEKGYDGFVYRNVHEDPGSLSWVNFYPEQVTSAGEPHSDQVD